VIVVLQFQLSVDFILKVLVVDKKNHSGLSAGMVFMAFGLPLFA
jgi:hypothetical protein